MINNNFKEAIKIINNLLTKTKIKWAFIGSTNMALQGINVNPNDLDLVVKLEDLSKIREIFSNYKPSEVEKLKPMTDEPGWEVKLIINGVDVHILGEKSTGEYVRKLIKNQIISIKLDNFKIPCFTLEAEAQAYSETKREHKANLIREFIRNLPKSI